VLRGREFGDQVHIFSCLSILHDAVVAWNMINITANVATCAPQDTRLKTKR